MVRLHKRISDSHVYGNRKYNSPGEKDRRELRMFDNIMEHDKHLDSRIITGCTYIRNSDTGKRNNDMRGI
jgi:hypothetical protein